MTIARTLLCALVCSLTLALVAIADVPTSMNIQGRLNDGSGNPAPAGVRTFTFKIFDQETAGTEVWPAGPGEIQTVTTGAGGLWSAPVGAVIPLTDAVFQDTSRWLEVTVDDGANPPETLSRIRLNTNPYSYRAASARNADAVGGYTAGKLDSLYVHVEGDTVSGRLVVSVPYKALPGASLRANNVNDLNSPTSYGPNTIAIAADAASDGFEGKFGVIGVGKGNMGGTTGVLGSGEGTGSFNAGIQGIAIDVGAAQNFSGFFYGGDIQVMAPATPGDSAVRLPDNSISSVELLNEPGLAQGVTPGSVDVTGAAIMIDIATTTLTIPAPGYILVEATGTVFWSGTLEPNLIIYQIDDTGGGSYDDLHVQQAGQDTPPNTGLNAVPFTVRRTYFEDAGEYTFRLEAMDLSLSGDKGIFNTVITAIYLPTGYGVVTTAAAADEAAGFESAREVVVGGVPGVASGATTQTSYAVDLRELELRAARARAEALLRDLELARARYEALAGGRSNPQQ